MAKRKGESKKPTVLLAVSTRVLAKPLISPLVGNLAFPELSQKNNLKCRTVLDDQILVIDVSLYFLHIRLHLTDGLFIEGFFFCGRMQGFYTIHRQTTPRTDPTEEAWRG